MNYFNKLCVVLVIIFTCFFTDYVEAEDLSPPEIVEFNISPNSVNVTDSSQSVTVTMRIIDNEAGVEKPNVVAGSDINNASTGFGSVSLVSGTDTDGIWEATLIVPKGSTSGYWSVSVFPLSDKASNSNSTFGPPNQFDSSFTVLSDSIDEEPPKLIEFNLSPNELDVTDSSQSVTVTMRIVDNDSGVEIPKVVAGSDVSNASTGFGNVSLVSGTDKDGIWEATLIVPKGSTSGPWSVSVFPLSDNASNSNSSFGPPNQFDSSFTVSSDLIDEEPPELIEFDLSPNEVDVTDSSQRVTVTMRIIDNQTGVEKPNVVAGSDINNASTGFGSVSLVSGTETDGIWEATLIVPKGSTSGSWSVSLFPLSDKASNSNSSFGPPNQFDSHFVVNKTEKAHKNDVDGDGKSDMLWRSSARGWNFLWAMDGVETKLAKPINVVQGDGWSMEGQGDYDEDGKSDIFWRNSNTGQNFIYLMDGTTIKARATLNFVTAPDWAVKASGDFNGDGKGDVMWRRVNRGDTWFYMMNGLQIGTNQPSLWVTDLNFEIVGAGDINGDGTDDVLWRHKVTGINYVWQMENGQITNRYTLNAINTDWTVAGLGDLDGDGTDDIILRNQSDGRNWAYMMEDGQIRESVMINQVANLNWQIANMGDYDGDGKTDFLWRDESAGRNIVHLMDGNTIKDKGVLRPTDNTWTLAK